MVMLVKTKKGLIDALRSSAKTGEAVWCGADAIEDEAFKATVPPALTRFDYRITGDDEYMLEDALSTIVEHHPGETVWVEQIMACPDQ